MSIESEFDLDLSWATKYQTLNNIDSHHKCEPMRDLNVYFVFIDSNNAIQHIECAKETIVDLSGCRGIHKDRLLQMIQSKKSMTGRKFKLFHMLFFHVDIQPENVSNFISRDDDDSSSFVKTPSCLVDLVVPDSLFVFHDVNSLFIFFSENKHDKVGLTRKVFGAANHRKTRKRVSFSV